VLVWVQVPEEQTSVVQELPSLQSALVEQPPQSVLVEQDGAQTEEVLATQVLPLQWEPETTVWEQVPVAGLQESVVQELPSLQLTLTTLEQVPVVGLQESVVQALLSLQFLTVPTQAPAPSQ